MRVSAKGADSIKVEENLGGASRESPLSAHLQSASPLDMYVLGATHEALASRVSKLETGHEGLSTLVKENTMLTKKIQANTEDLVTATVVFRGFLKVATWVASIASAIAAVIGVVVATRALSGTGL